MAINTKFHNELQASPFDVMFGRNHKGEKQELSSVKYDPKWQLMELVKKTILTHKEKKFFESQQPRFHSALLT